MTDQSSAADTDLWYQKQYWVTKEEAPKRPPRCRELPNAPLTDRTGLPLSFERADLATGQVKQVPWFGAFILSTSCELGAKAKEGIPVQIARVKNLAGVNPADCAKIVTGWSQGSSGPTIAFAYFAYLAPVAFSKNHNEEMFVDYHETVWVNSQDLLGARRVAALDHDARVSLIRREIYYKYRWLLATSDVRAAEAYRISNDPDYQGQKPDWAQ